LIGDQYLYIEMKNIMIERIIKQFLFEQRRYTAVVKAAPIASTTKSVGAGAVYAFFVRFRFKPGAGVIPTEKQLYKELATIISENTEVGKSSKYANGKYVYVVSNRLKESDNRLLFNVWIYTEDVYNSMYASSVNSVSGEDDRDNIVIETTTPYHIGSSKMQLVGEITAKNINNPTPEALKLQKLAKTINTTPVSQETPDLGSNVKMNPKDLPIETPGGEVLGDEEEVLGDNDVIKKTTDDKIEYPYTTKEGKVIYTTGPTDDWVYIYANNIWYGMKKPEFEQYQLSGGIVPKFLEIKNKTAIITLNKLANITAITTKQSVINTKTDNDYDFYVSYNNNEYVYRDGQFYSRPKGYIEDYEKRTLITDPVLIKNIKEKSDGANIENAPWKKQSNIIQDLTLNKPVTFKRDSGPVESYGGLTYIRLYTWDTKLKKWKDTKNAYYPSMSNSQKLIKLGVSSDKSHTLVQFDKSKEKYWVLSKLIK